MDKDDFSASRWLVPLGLILGTALLLLFPLAKPIWTDEWVSISWGRSPLPLILSGRFGSPDALPLHPLILALFGRPLGDSLAVHRIVSALPAAIGLWYVYLLGRRLSTRAGVLALWLCALSPGLILFDRMSRYHGTTTLLATMSCYYFVRLLTEGDRKLVVKYGLATAAMLLSYTLSLFVVAAQFALLVLWWRRAPRPLAILAAMAAAGAAFLAYFVPNLIRASQTLVNITVEDPGMGQGIGGFLRRLLLPVYVFCVGETLSPWKVWLSVPGCLAALGSFALGGWALRRRPELVVPLACVVVVILSALATSGKLGSSQTVGSMAKRVSFALPLFYITLVAGVYGLKNLRWRAVLTGILLLVSGVSTYNYFAGREFLNPNYTANWSEAVETIQKVPAGPDTVVYSSADPPVKFYIDEARLGLPVIEERGIDSLKKAIDGGAKRIWLFGRDRGDRTAVADFEDARAFLTKVGARRTQKHGVYPRTDDEKKWLGKALKREIWDHYIQFDLWELP
jgi:hypothetical protein